MYEWFFLHKDLCEGIYSALLFLICILIVLRSDKLFRLSFHQGIRYFRNAFFFYGLAFFIKGFLNEVFELGLSIYLFEIFVLMGSFSLFYSLIWKRFESGDGAVSSIFNLRMLIFWLMTILIVTLDFFWGTHLLLFAAQFLIFVIATVLSLSNCSKGLCKKKGSFSRLYFFAISILLISWILQILLEAIFFWYPGILIAVYILNLLVFVTILFGVIKLTSFKN